MSFEIRAACADDFDAIADITNHYIETSAIHFAYGPVTSAELRAAWTLGQPRYPWLVAADDRVLGYAKAAEWRTRDAYRWTVEIGLYVHRDHHGAGIGSALYGELIALVKRAGFRSVIGGITLPNEVSVALHHKLGFEHVGTVRDAGYKHDRWHDVAFYQLRLNASEEPPPA